VSAFPSLATVRFEFPARLWWLAALTVVFALWLWRLGRYRRDARRYQTRRLLPGRAKLPVFGGLLFWLVPLAAAALLVVALARPTAAVSLVRNAGVDIVVLQDGSASMHVTDVRGDRWRRSIQFLRVLGESLRWKNDRMALALFARIAAPQIRLTTDPNTFFFFLDHLNTESPFRLADDTTWDTNIELGIHWGLRLIEKDESLHGRSPNAQVFVMVSDGQAWSGAVAKAITEAQTRGVPIMTVGVGTASGGNIPEPPLPPDTKPPLVAPRPIHSSLDRTSLQTIAASGGGQYFELDRDDDRDIADRIIDTARRRAGSQGLESRNEELYWPCLFVAGCLVALGAALLAQPAELWIYTAGGGGTLLLLWALLH
jgi:Ca-activated chloride channel family protein